MHDASTQVPPECFLLWNTPLLGWMALMIESFSFVLTCIPSSELPFSHRKHPFFPKNFVPNIKLKASGLMKIATLFSTGSAVLIPSLVQPSSFQWHSSGKLLACQPHRSFREKYKFHLDTFWTPLNTALSQASREPVFITGWIQLQRDQELSLFWVTSIIMA